MLLALGRCPQDVQPVALEVGLRVYVVEVAAEMLGVRVVRGVRGDGHIPVIKRLQVDAVAGLLGSLERTGTGSTSTTEQVSYVESQHGQIWL
jgi:hypothetical protein